MEKRADKEKQSSVFKWRSSSNKTENVLHKPKKRIIFWVQISFCVNLLITGGRWEVIWVI